MTKNYIAELLEFIYGKAAAESALSSLTELLDRFKPDRAGAGGGITHKDALLISYGDMLSGTGENALSRLRRFLENRNKGSFTFLHLLPFHPYSSDDGFSVIDYRQVDPRMGGWEDIEKLGRQFKMTFDFVINHGSVRSEWFRQFLADGEKFRNWYLTRNENYDWSTVVRPRTHPLLTPFTKDDGRVVRVWTTFSADQADYDFSRPEVLLEFIAIFLDYCRRGGRMLRLDAIAYLWKEDGTPCLHHPKTHAIVKLFRALIDYLGLPLLLLTETNVPHRENVSYFGAGGTGALRGPEAHLVYNFALPPLTLYAAISADAGPLRNWAAALPPLPPGNCFLNFLASHDGVGLTPAAGIVDPAAFARTLDEAQKRGALISFKSTPSGPVPYELNCSWADMVAPESLGPPEVQARALLATYAAAMALPGLPAVYFHSWIGSRSWKEGPGLLGYNRAINREKPGLDRLERELAEEGSFRSLTLDGFQKLLEFRSAEASFDPAAPCRVLESGDNSVFALLRGTENDGVICVHNFSPDPAKINTGIPVPDAVSVAGRGFRWIAYDSGGIRRELAL